MSVHTKNPPAAFKKLGGKDYCAYWFEAMRKLGYDDRVWAVRIDPQAPEHVLEVRRYSHAIYDAYGTCEVLGRDTQDRYEFLDAAVSTRPPLSLWQTLRTPKRPLPYPQAMQQAIPWLPPAPSSAIGADGYGGQIVLDVALMERVRAHCAAIPCSVNSWIAWAFHQTVQRTLLAQPAPLVWTYMVSMRPWVALDDVESNHIAGLKLALGPGVQARGVADEIKACFSAQDHWRSWYRTRIGRVIGRWGVLQVYKRVRNQGHTAGHISHVGRVRNRSGATWALSGIPSPNAPLNFDTFELNDGMVAALRVDPSFGFSERAPNAQALLRAFKETVLAALQPQPQQAA